LAAGTNVQFTPKLDEVYIPVLIATALWYCPVDDMDILTHEILVGGPFPEGTRPQLIPKLDEVYIPPPLTTAV
jgi:hypothetical protein